MVLWLCDLEKGVHMAACTEGRDASGASGGIEQDAHIDRKPISLQRLMQQHPQRYYGVFSFEFHKQHQRSMWFWYFACTLKLNFNILISA